MTSPQVRNHGVYAPERKKEELNCKIFLESDEKITTKLLSLPVTREGGC